MIYFLLAFTSICVFLVCSGEPYIPHYDTVFQTLCGGLVKGHCELFCFCLQSNNDVHWIACDKKVHEKDCCTFCSRNLLSTAFCSQLYLFFFYTFIQLHASQAF